MNIVSEKFENLKSEIDKLKEIVVKEIDNLHELLNIKPVQTYEKLLIEDITVRLERDSNDEPIEIVVWFSEELRKILKIPNNTIRFKDNESMYKYVLELIDKVVELEMPKYQQNIEKMNSNKKTFETIYNLLKKLRIREEYWGYQKGRKNPTWIKYNWVSEIKKECNISYNSFLPEQADYLKSKIQEYYQLVKENIAEKEREIQQEIERQNRLLKLGKLIAEYNLPDNCKIEDLLQAIIQCDRYLYLAHYLEQAYNLYESNVDNYDFDLDRHEFDEQSFLIARKGFDFFKQHIDSTDNVDIEIIDGIFNIIRKFEDYHPEKLLSYKWNFNRLFELVKNNNPQLYEDYIFVKFE